MPLSATDTVALDDGSVSEAVALGGAELFPLLDGAAPLKRMTGANLAASVVDIARPVVAVPSPAVVGRALRERDNFTVLDVITSSSLRAAIRNGEVDVDLADYFHEAQEEGEDYGLPVTVPFGLWTVSQLLLERVTIITHGRRTRFQQLSGQPAITPVLRVVGPQVHVQGLLSVRGNISTDTGEWNHAVECIAEDTDLYDIRFDDILGQDIRGDTVYFGEGPGASGALVDATYGHVRSDNVYRNGVSLVGGSGSIRGKSSTGSAVGYMMYDIEPDTGSNPQGISHIDYVRGCSIGVVGTTGEKHAGWASLGMVDLDPAHNTQSTPAYTPGNTIRRSGLWARNFQSLTIGRLKSRSHTHYPVEAVSGEECFGTTEIVHLDLADENLNAGVGGVLAVYVALGQTFKNLKVNGGIVRGLGDDRTLFAGDNANPDNSPIIASNIDCDGRIATDVGGGRFERVNSTEAGNSMFVRCQRNLIRACEISSGRIFLDGHDNQVDDCVLTATTALTGTFGGDAAYQRQYTRNTTVGGTRRDQSLAGLIGSTAYGNANQTLTPYASPIIARLNVALTAARTITLATTGLVAGAEFDIVREAGSTGGPFDWTIQFGAGPTTVGTLSASGDRMKVFFDGTNWIRRA